MFSLPVTLHPTPTPTQTLDTPTARHLVTVMDPPSPSHSWRVVTSFNQTKWKSSMNPPEGTAESGVLIRFTRPAQNKQKQQKKIENLFAKYNRALKLKR